MHFRLNNDRRDFLRISAASGAVLILNSCGGQSAPSVTESSKQPSAKKGEEEKGGEVTATEDLMREHGVLRRVLLVYSETAAKLRCSPLAVAPNALQKTAQLFRAFGEEYHERKLEEAYIFPAVKRAGGPAAGYPDILIAQHTRGREITDYIIAVTKGAKLGAATGAQLAGAMDSLVRMYRAHASREDTIVFPVWKQTLSAQQLDEMNDKFEDIEHEQFGEDGFEDAVKQISEIEKELGLADLAGFTAPPAPAVNRRRDNKWFRMRAITSLVPQSPQIGRRGSRDACTLPLPDMYRFQAAGRAKCVIFHCVSFLFIPPH